MGKNKIYIKLWDGKIIELPSAQSIEYRSGRHSYQLPIDSRDGRQLARAFSFLRKKKIGEI